MRFAWLVLALLPGCLASEDSEPPVASVRLELVNEGATPVSAWLRAEDEAGAIRMHAQLTVPPGGSDGREQDLVIEGLEQFRAILSHTGEDERTLARGIDADCRFADRIVFRVVVNVADDDMHLTCQ